MKSIKYKLHRKIVCRTESSNGQVQATTKDTYIPVTLPWSEKNEDIARKAAYKGEYEIIETLLNVKDEVERLKAQLAASDYKIIKCYECQLVGEELPYNIEELHTERQAIRDEINKLENS